MRRKFQIWLVLGDFLTLLLLTIAGFASHQELTTAGWRLLTTFLPLCIAWAMTAPALGLYRAETVFSPKQLWKPLWGMFLAAPLAALLRGLWLNRPISPVFAIVLTSFGMLGILLWRLTFWLLLARRIRDG